MKPPCTEFTWRSSYNACFFLSIRYHTFCVFQTLFEMIQRGLRNSDALIPMLRGGSSKLPAFTRWLPLPSCHIGPAEMWGWRGQTFHFVQRDRKFPFFMAIFWFSKQYKPHKKKVGDFYILYSTPFHPHRIPIGEVQFFPTFPLSTQLISSKSGILPHVGLTPKARP